MFMLFLSLFPFYYISLLGTELGMTALSMKKGRFVFYSSGTFIIILGASLIFLVKTLSIYGLPIGLAIGQIFAMTMYVILLNKLHKMVDMNFIRVQINTIIVATLMIVANFLSASHMTIQISMSASLFLVWLLADGKSAINAMKFVTAKGEIR